jgi:hypothetical protein
MQAEHMNFIVNIKVSLTFKKIEQAIKCVYTTNININPKLLYTLFKFICCSFAPSTKGQTEVENFKQL